MKILGRSFSLAKLLSIGVRLLALVGRFGFAMIAIFFLSPTDYGIYGLITAGTYVFSQIAGIEAFQSVVRRIVAGYGPDDDDERPQYLRFILFSMTLAFAMGAGMGYYFDWPVSIILMAGGIIALEYVGIEAMRLLTAENRPELSLYSVSIRFVLWSIGFPLAGLLGILPGPWKLEWVLSAWLLSSMLSVLFLWPIRGPYLKAQTQPFIRWYWVVLKDSPKWIIIALVARFLESGIRMVPGFIIDEVAAGQFSFLATVASVGGLILKASIEPHYFSAMVHPETGADARISFAKITIFINAFGAVVAYAVWFGASHYGHRDLGPHSAFIVGLLLLASVTTSLSQIPHFQLYAQHKDRALLSSAVITALVGVPLVVGTTWIYGLIGTAAGGAMTGTIFLAIKFFFARKLKPAGQPAKV